MRFPRFAVIFLISAFFSQAASAQEPVRQKASVTYPIRDTLSKRAIELQYAAEISKCKSQINTLNGEIVQLIKKIKELQLASVQAENDFNTWLVNYQKSRVRKDSQAVMMKQFELKKKLDANTEQIHQCTKDIKFKKLEIKELESHIAKLEKEKEALLNKLN